MPRSPLGTYRRTTGDWFQHSRAIAGGYVSISTDTPASIGLFNSDQSGRVCHILGVTIGMFTLQESNMQPWLGGYYYSSIGGAFDGVEDEAFPDPVQPFFDLDPAPNVEMQFGYTVLTQPTVGRMVPLFQNLSIPQAVNTIPSGPVASDFYPDGGVAAFKPGRGFALSCIYVQDSITPMVWGVTFDFVMLQD